MSDVSGIPYMGPMGQGNFFAPQFPANPQINPTAGYAAPMAYNQNVVNNLYTGGGFGAQTAAYAYAGAAYDRAVPRSTGGMYMFSDTGGPAGGGPGGGGLDASPYHSTPNVFDTGASPFWGGGGSSGLGGSIFGGNLGGNAQAIDWSGVGQAAGNLFGGKQDPYPGMSMPGGLGSPASAPSGASPFNWSDLWSGGGAKADPAPGMAMPGGLGSPMATPFQSPSTDYNKFQGSGYSSGIAPDTTGGRDFEWPTADPAPGMAMPGGLGSPTTMLPAIEVDETSKAQDQAPFDFSGPTTGWNNAPAPMPDTQQLLGYDPQQGPVETDWSTFQSPATNYETFQAPAQGGGQDPYSGDKSAEQIANEARDRLAGIIGSPETAKAVEEAEKTAAIPLPRERPDEAGSGTVRVDTRQDTLDTLRKELQASGLVMTSGYRDPSHPLSLANPKSAHSQARAFDVRARTPEQADNAIGEIRGLLGARGLVEGRDYRIIDEVRHPSGHATGPHVHTQFTEEGMQRYQQEVYNPPRPPADIPPQGPLPPERPQPLPEGTSRPPANVFPEARLAPNGQEPTAFVVHHTEGRPTLEGTVADWKTQTRVTDLGSQYFLDRNGVLHDVAAETGYTGTNQTRTGNIQGAKDLNNSNVVGVEVSARNTADMTPKQIAALNQFVEQRYPSTPVYGHAEIDSGKDADEGVARANEILDARVAANPSMFPSAGFWDQLADQNKSAGIPLPVARPEGADVARPSANVGPSGVEKAQTFLNTSVEKLLRQYQPDKAGVAGMFIDTKQPLREALKGPYGGQILEGLQPRLGEAGLKRDDLAKAIADPRARFVEGGDFGPYPAYTGPEAAPGDSGYTSGIAPDTTGGRTFSGDVYSQFRQSENVEDRRGETGPIVDTPIDNTWWQNAAPLQFTGDVSNGGYNYIDEAADEMADLPLSPSRPAEQRSPEVQRNMDELASEALKLQLPGEAGRRGYLSDTSMRDFQSPANDYSAFQQLTPIPAWQASLPPGRNGPEVVEAVKAMAARLRTDPAEIAAMVQQETHDSPSALWNPQITPNRYGYRGLTQMGRDTFTDAARLGMPIGGFPTIEDYQRGTAEQQIAAYGDWLDLYTLQNPQGAAAFINSGGLAGMPPGEAASFLQGTQFAPNATSWVRAYEQGDRDMPTTATRQAPELRSKSINDMTAAARSHMAAWPQQRIWSDYNMPRRPGGY